MSTRFGATSMVMRTPLGSSNIACCLEKVRTQENHIQICKKELSVIPKEYNCSIHFSKSCDTAIVGDQVLLISPGIHVTLQKHWGIFILQAFM